METSSPLRKSLELAENKFVNACAGAGKTFALSKRYCRILDDFTHQNPGKPKNQWLGVNNILVITFTKKAAAEMASRIYKDLNKLLKGEKIPEMENQGIDLGENIIAADENYKLWLRSTFSQNYISTIDGFCSRILRENAHLVGIDPKFQTSDEIQTDRFFEEFLEDFLRKKSERFDDKLKKLLNGISISNLRQYLRYLFEERATVSDWADFIENNSPEEIFRQWTNLYTPDFEQENLLAEFQKIAAFADYYVAPADNAGSIKFSDLREQLDKLSDIEDNIEKRRFIATKILSIFLTESGTYLKTVNYWKKSNWKPEKTYKDFKTIVIDFCNYLRDILPENEIRKTPNEYDRKAIPILKTLVEFYRDFYKEFEQKQREINFLNFEDIILNTRKLLRQNPKIARKYARQFRHIMVDEFQDTNDLRWNIIKLIAEDFSAENSNNERKKETKNEKDNSRYPDNFGSLRKAGIFIVGDKKQSIYRFNQADVEVMNRAETELTTDEATEKIVIAFNDNFRSSQDYIEFVINPLFENILRKNPAEIKPFEANFEPTNFHQNNKSDKNVAAKTETVCTIRLTNCDKDEHQQNPGYISALNAALTVKEFLRWAEETNLQEKVVVGVLLRKFSNIQNYLKVFREYEIPFEIIGGRGLFQQQEAYDLFHFVSVLLNPLDDLALIGLLRSPFFALTDGEIQKINLREKDEPVFSYLERTADFKQICNQINKWRSQAAIISIDELLENILAEDWRELGYFSELGGLQRVANIDKLLVIIRNLALKGTDLQNIYDFFKYQINAQSDTAQADFPSDAKVQIMSIHRSKGLEFPAVILPELNAQPKANTLSIFHGKIVPNGRIEVGITLDEMGESKKTNLLQAIKKQAKAEDEAEDKRLFYVAVTRAKYKIAFLADTYEEQKNSNNWWRKYIVPNFGIAAKFEENQNRFDEKKKTEITFLNYEDLRQKFPRQQTETLKWSDFLPKFSKRKILEISPHDIMKSISQIEKEENISTEGNNFALAFGTIFHKIMEKEWFDLENSRSEISAYLQNYFPNISWEMLSENMKNHLNNFLQSDIYRKISNAATEKFPELPVLGWLENGEIFLQVSGVIDLLYKTENRWFILDYKTDKDKSKLPQYTLQLQTYQWIAKQLFGIEAAAEIFFSALGETEKIEWNENYFSKIFPEIKKTFHPILPDVSLIPSEIENIFIKHKNLLVINPTKQQNILFMKALAAKKLLQPGVRFLTFNRFIESFETNGITVSNDFVRLLIRKITEGKNFSDGTVELLSEAILENEKWQTELNSKESVEIEETFKKIKREKNYLTVADKMRLLGSQSFAKHNILLNGFYKNSPLEFDLIKAVSQSAANFYFIDNFDRNRLKTAFSYSHRIWEKQFSETGNPQIYKTCFSVFQEIEQVAINILEIPDWKRKIDKIKIAASGLEKYVPVIRKIFRDYDIPVRFLQNRSVQSHPIFQLLQSFLNYLTTDKPKWENIFAVLLHPLMKPSKEVFAMEIFCRRNGKIYSDEDDDLLLQFPQVAEIITNFRQSYSQKEILAATVSFLQNLPIDDDAESVAVLEKIASAADNLQNYYHILEWSPDKKTVKNDLINLLETTEIHLKEHNFGIEVMGFLDTLDLQPEKLFLLGMNENAFPVTKPTNPFLKKIPNYSWFVSACLLSRWNELGEKVKYFAPERDLDGAALQVSTLLENFTNEETILSNLENLSRRNFLKKYYGKYISDFPNQRQIVRHNSLLDSKISEFSGKTEPSQKTKLTFSSSSFDKLLQCPQKYWFATVLKVRETDFNEERENKKILGNVIHKALEKFGKGNGFRILQTDFPAACNLLSEKIKEACSEFGVNPTKNLLLKNIYKIYRDNLFAESGSNVLVRLLKWNREKFSGFQKGFFEQKFGMTKKDKNSWNYFRISGKNLELSFRGIIDKILLFSDKKIIATDYKTGNFNFKNTVEKLGSQFILYYLALQEHFPEAEIEIAVEQIKSLRKNEHGLSRFLKLDDTRKSFVVPLGKKSKELLSHSEIIEYFLTVAAKVIAGEFQVAKKELQQNVCKYCEFKGICRKNTLF